MADLLPLHDYQENGLERVQAIQREDPGTPVLAVGPCGSGKSRCMMEACLRTIYAGGRAGIVSHRELLTEQLGADFDRAGVPYTVYGAGYKYDPDCPAVIVKGRSVYERAIRRGTEDLPELDLVNIDEAHVQAGASMKATIWGAIKEGAAGPQLFEGWAQRGAKIIGWTATPLMKRGIYGHLVDFGAYSLMRQRKMHQLVHVYSPDEVDVSHLSANAMGDYSAKELEEITQTIGLHGSVIGNYRQLNPFQLPMILFAPSVESSKWFAECFCAEGIPVAHMDGEMIGWPDMSRPAGVRLQYMESTAENRAALLAAHKEGTVKGICNRFVLREAVNMPWTYHAILATVMGGLSSYLQAVGRLQRYWPDYDHKILQCHGGHYWRHGSPNEDRKWNLGDTNLSKKKERVEAVGKGEKPEGIRCSKCGGWRIRGKICPHCGHHSIQCVRAIRQSNGELRLQRGRVYKKVAAATKLTVAKIWRSRLWRSAACDHSVSSAVHLFLEDVKESGLDWNRDWSKIPDRPPQPGTPDWGKPLKVVYPFLRRAKKRDPKAVKS